VKSDEGVAYAPAADSGREAEGPIGGEAPRLVALPTPDVQVDGQRLTIRAALGQGVVTGNLSAVKAEIRPLASVKNGSTSAFKAEAWMSHALAPSAVDPSSYEFSLDLRHDRIYEVRVVAFQSPGPSVLTSKAVQVATTGTSEDASVRITSLESLGGGELLATVSLFEEHVDQAQVVAVMLHVRAVEEKAITSPEASMFSPEAGVTSVLLVQPWTALKMMRVDGGKTYQKQVKLQSGHTYQVQATLMRQGTVSVTPTRIQTVTID
jgi:hypothetical protein